MMGRGQTRKWWHGNLSILCLFVVIGAVIYGNSLQNIFHYDDFLTIEVNRNIHSLKNINKFFTDPSMSSAIPYMALHYRPLVVLSYALNYAAGGLNPAGYHLVNLAFHVGSAFVVFVIVQAMLWGVGNRGIGGQGGFEIGSLAAGLIFLVHPFNSEAVNYITARSSLMSGFFYLLAFYCWVSYRKNPPVSPFNKGGLWGIYCIASLLAFVAGMLSKEVAVTLPLVLFLYDLYFPPILNTQYSTLRTLIHWRTYIPYLPFVLIVLIPYLLLRFFSYGEVLPTFQRDMITQLQTELPVLVEHWRMFFLPYPLTPVHDVEIHKTLWSFPVIYSALILLIYSFVSLYLLCVSSYPWRVVSFFMVWFFIVLLPTTIIPLNTIFQENRGYLAIVSFVITAGIIIEEVAKHYIRKIVITGLIILVVVYSIAVIQRNRIWKDDLTLWEDTVEKVPRSAEAYTSLADAYRRAGMFDRAIEATRRALVIGSQRNFYVHDILARIYLAQSKWDLAAKEFEIEIQNYPYISAAHNELGTVYYRMEKLDLAEREYIEAIRLDPGDYIPYFNLGILHETRGKRKEAIQAYRNSLSLFPTHVKSHYKLGLLLEEQGEKREASEHYRQVLHLAGKSDDMMVMEAGSHLGRIGK